jgi:EpsI family protein
MSARPPRLDRRQLLIGGALVATSGAALVIAPRRTAPALPLGGLDRGIPERIGPYRHHSDAGVVAPLRGQLSERLYDGYVARTYVALGEAPIMLLIAYGRVQDSQFQLHRPESCYPAFGYELGASQAVEIPLADRVIDGITLTASRQGVNEQLLYWTRIGPSFPTGFWSERAVILRDALSGGIPDGALVRLSTVSDDAVAATTTLANFNRMMMQNIGPIARACLLGPTARSSPARA